jgi:hypothetical protein
MWRIEFQSDHFLPYLPESSQVTPGAYGFELATWLSQRLAARGIVLGYPVSEDWGWQLDYVEGDTVVHVGCASEASEGDGYEGKPIRWRVFVRQPVSLVQRWRGLGKPAKPREIASVIVVALSEADITASLTEA